MARRNRQAQAVEEEIEMRDNGTNVIEFPERDIDEMPVVTTRDAGAIKGEALMEIIECPQTASDALRVLQQYGVFRGVRYVPREDVTPGDYVRHVLPAVAVLGDRAEWAAADALAWGERFDGVEAIDVETGQAADPDDAFEDAGSIVPYQHDQMVGDIVRHASQTLLNRRSVARRFPPEATENPAWSAARYSHYAVCAPRDLPDDVVDGWLKRAGRPTSEGGMTVDDIERARTEWRQRRDALAKAQASQLTAVPKPESGSGGAEPRTVLSPGTALQICRPLLRNRILAVVDLPPATVDELVLTVIKWLYDDVTNDVLRSAIEYEGSDVDPWDD